MFLSIYGYHPIPGWYDVFPIESLRWYFLLTQLVLIPYQFFFGLTYPLSYHWSRNCISTSFSSFFFQASFGSISIISCSSEIIYFSIQHHSIFMDSATFIGCHLLFSCQSVVIPKSVSLSGNHLYLVGLSIQFSCLTR